MAFTVSWKRGTAMVLIAAMLLGAAPRVWAEETSEGPQIQEAAVAVADTDTVQIPDAAEDLPDQPVCGEETALPDGSDTAKASEETEEEKTGDVPVLPEEDAEGEADPSAENDSGEDTDVSEGDSIPKEDGMTKETDASEKSGSSEETDVSEENSSGEDADRTEASNSGADNDIPEESGSAAEVTQQEKTDGETASEETDTLMESEELEMAMFFSAGAVPIAEVLAMGPGQDEMTIEGIVVFAMGPQAVLQDATGGIRLSFAAPPEIQPGDALRVTGRRSGGFAVVEFEKTGTGDLPAQAATLDEDRNAQRILVKGAVLGQGTLTQNGYTCPLKGSVPDALTVGQRVDVWGVMLDGVFYGDTFAAAEKQEPERTLDGTWNIYFGQLHAHTNISDGLGSVEEAFAYARQVEDLDFFAVTDHSNSFDNAQQGAVDKDGASVSQEWAAGKAAAAAVSNEDFVGIFGYEMTWPEDLVIGHINTFGTPGWQTRDQAGMNTLAGYLDALAAVPDSISQFNHPGAVYGDFCNFTDYVPRYDARVHLLEVGGEGSFTAYDAYTTALDAGWHLAPSNNQNNHNGGWGAADGSRTVVLARELTEEAIFDAVRNYRAYATEDADLKILYHLNDRIMGSIMGEAETLRADVRIADDSGDGIGRVEVVTDGGKVVASLETREASLESTLDVPPGGSYYYLRVIRDGQTVAVTAPVWVDAYEDLGIAELTTDTEKPTQGTGAQLRLTLFNHEDLPFILDSITFSAGSQVIERIALPGNVSPVDTFQLHWTYTQKTAGAVTVTATVDGSIGEVPRSYQKTITLYYQAPKAELHTMEEVRGGALGTAYRVRGYVTAGTANSYNTFPNSIYLQDDTGGIQITDFTQEDIQIGTPMEVEGILRSAGGNLVLAMTDHEILKEDYYRYAPRTMAHATAMDYEAHGGELLQIEGHVVSVTKTADGLGVSRFTLRDIVGDLATVMVEDGIGSGVYGTNELTSEVKSGRAVRAMGLLHIDEYGEIVLRVRNCDEVAYVPPKKDPTNPRTGDWMRFLRFFG